ncbi:MAG: ATP-binding protein [Actinomycetota bacterium]
MITHGVAEQLRLIDRAVTTLTRSTEALLRATSEQGLLDEVCRIAVEIAGYRLAWVGYARDDAQRTVSPVAQAGIAADYLAGIKVSWNDQSLGRGPTGTAIRTGVPQVIRDTETTESFAPWRTVAHDHGFRSVVSLPIGHGANRLGALTIYAAEPDAFDSDTIRLLEDLGRNLSYGIGALRMKAEHDRAVQDLAESEERYRTLIELSPDAILVHHQGVLLFANPVSSNIFGAPDGAILVGQPVLDLVAEADRPRIAVHIANPRPGRMVDEVRMKRADGAEFDADVVSTAIVFHGLTARLLVVRDVTERRQVQQQLLQSAKLATLGEMAAGLVHELSQPLNIIRLTAEGALMFIERGKATQEWQAQQFQLVADQAQRTAEIIDDIRIFSRRDNSPVQVFDATQAVRSAVGVLGAQFRPDDIDLAVDLPGAAPVRGRRVQLEQVVMNLLTNAHHAVRERREQMPADWRGRVSVRADMEGGRLDIVVSDNGPGIPPELRPRIFEPFFTTKEAGRGTGLGLSVSFGIINAMGGRLEAIDCPEGGACFRIVLPIDHDAHIEDKGHGQPPPGPQAPVDGHIMVVDDERAAAEVLAGFLREFGYRITVASTGAEAWERFMADPADVVITDLRMPAGGGEQLVEKLRDFDPLLPIVIVTGHLGATERLAANLEDDRCAVLKKPVALGKLGELVATFLQPPPE